MLAELQSSCCFLLHSLFVFVNMTVLALPWTCYKSLSCHHKRRAERVRNLTICAENRERLVASLALLGMFQHALELRFDLYVTSLEHFSVLS